MEEVRDGHEVGRRPRGERAGRSAVSRRGFLVGGGVVAAGLATAPGRAPGAVSPETLRVALIGVGGRGTAHLRNVLKNPYARVVTVCDIDPGALERAAGLVEGAGQKRPGIVEDYRRVLDDSSIDAVFSATPCDVHHGIYMDSIAAGKHLYGEKPMCITVREANEIVARQERYPRVKVQIGFQRRCNPRFIQGIKLIREDRILGEIIEGRAAYNNSWTPKAGLGGPGSWQSRRRRSGDWMLEQAVHAWDVLNWVAGTTPRSAYGLGHHRVFNGYDPERDVTDYYSAILEYPGNLVIQFSHSWISPRDPAFDGTYTRFVGLLGGIELDTGKIIFSSRAEEPHKVETFQEDIPDPTMLSINSFIDAVLQDRTPSSTVYNGRDASLVGLLVRKAVYERRSVTWEEMLASA